jgi:hypothetical protein
VARCVGDFGGVQCAHEWEVPARCICEAADRTSRIGGRRVADGEHRARGTERDCNIAGAQPEAERRGHVVAGALRGLGPEHGRECCGPVDVRGDELEEIEAVLAGAGGPVPGARRVTAVGPELAGEPQRQPVVREHDVGDTREDLGLGTVQPRELGDRERGDRYRATRVGPCRGATIELVEQPLASGATGVVPELRRTEQLAGRVEDDEAVLPRRRRWPRNLQGDRPQRGATATRQVSDPARARWRRRRMRGPAVGGGRPESASRPILATA